MGLEKGWLVLRAERSFAGGCPPRDNCAAGPRVRAVPVGLELGCSIPEHGALLPVLWVGAGSALDPGAKQRGWLELAVLC